MLQHITQNITAQTDTHSQVEPDKQLDTLYITFDQPDTDDDPCANCRDHACEYGSCSMSRG